MVCSRPGRRPATATPLVEQVFVSSETVIGPAEEFEDGHEDETSPPLLPPEDRLWRHPSEVGRSLSREDDGVAAARRRWMTATPTRAGAGAAGLVGALLATGVVLIGTHLTGWLAPAGHAPAARSVDALRVVQASPTTMALHSAITTEMATVGAAMARIRVTRGNGATIEAEGAFISPSGYVLAPAPVLAGASSISVISSGGEEAPAVVSGTDSATGIAVLKVKGVSGLAWLEISAARAAPGSLALTASWRDGAADLSVASLGAGDGAASLGSGPALLEASPSSLRLARAPLGTLVLNGETEIIGMVTGHHRHDAIMAPGWLVSRVSGYLICCGKVTHGWLGINGSPAVIPPRYAGSGKATGVATRLISTTGPGAMGVRIDSVIPGGAAAKAGLAPGEVIEAVDGRRVHDMGDLKAMLYLMPPSAPVTIDVVRLGGTSVVSARLQPAA